MKRKIKITFLCFTVVLLVVVIFLFVSFYRQNSVIATINGEPIFQSDYERVRELNPDLTDNEIMNSIMKELIVYQEANNLGFNVENDVLKNTILSLKIEMPDLYLICIEEYGTEEAYAEALSYTMLYEMVYEYNSEQYISHLEINNDAIIQEVLECNYASEDELVVDEEKIIASYLKEKYRDEIRENFNQWKNEELEKAIIKYLR